MLSDNLPNIRVVDARRDPLAAAEAGAVRALRDGIFGPFRAATVPALPLADRIARRWLARSASPYLAEIDAIAARTKVAGVHAINISYEYACTTLGCVDSPGRAPTLRRTLDWPFLGLGRSAIVLHRSGPAGEFLDVTWPGAVGTLTAVAPGRFAAAINQAPLLRRTGRDFMRPLDYTRNFAHTFAREHGMPPLHLLRHVFETAQNFDEALERLTHTELARPVLMTLVGCRSDEIAVIERRERDATVHRESAPVANDWRQPLPGWEPRPCALPDRRIDSVTRCAAMERAVAASDRPFGWVTPPIRNWNTRIAVETNPGEGWIRVVGYEPSGPADTAPATRTFEHAFDGFELQAASA